MALLGGPRFFYRLLKDRSFNFSNGSNNAGQVPVMLVGAGDGAELFIRSLRRTASSGYEVVGIVAEDKRRIGREIHGVEVLGSTHRLLVEIMQVQYPFVSQNLKGITDTRKSLRNAHR